MNHNNSNLELTRRQAVGTAVGGLFLGGATSGIASADEVETIAEGTTVYIGVGSGVYGLDADSGEEVFETDLEEITWSSPTVVDGTIYLGDNGGDDDDSTLYAIDAQTGDIEWTFTDPGDWVWSSPTVVDDTVYVGEGGGLTTDEWDYSVFALDAETGEKEWAFDVGDRVRSSPNVVDGRVYVGSFDGSVYAIDAETGDQEWTYDTQSEIEASPTVVDGTVYVGSVFDGGMYAIDAENGEEVWSRDEFSEVISSATVVDGTVYVGGGQDFDDEEGALYALDTEDGETDWSLEVDEAVESSPTVYDEMVYVGSFDGYVYAVDAADGEEQWSFEIGESIESSPTVYDGTVYVSGGDGSLYALDADSGDEEWAESVSFSFRSQSPTVVEDASGDSVGSRVELGTLGHHHTWTEEASDPDDPDEAVEFTNPGDGETITAPNSVEATVEGIDLSPPGPDADSHLHLYVDEPFVDGGDVIPFEGGYFHLTSGGTQLPLNEDHLAPGERTLRLQLGDGGHVAVDAPTDEIAVTVEGVGLSDLEPADASVEPGTDVEISVQAESIGVDDEQELTARIVDVPVELDTNGASFVFDTVGSDAYIIEDETQVNPPEARELVAVDEENPTITLAVGTRYTFNLAEAFPAHPIEFRNEDGDVLLAHEEDIDGSFEDDPAVAWVADGPTVAFTLTRELAAELDTYVCTNHAVMEGDIETPEPLMEVTETVSLSTDGNTSVSFDTLDTDGLDGRYVHEVVGDDDAVTGELIVQDGPTVDDYADDDTGAVETDGLRDAIDHWRNGDIETDLLRDVIDAWRSG